MTNRRVVLEKAARSLGATLITGCLAGWVCCLLWMLAYKAFRAVKHHESPFQWAPTPLGRFNSILIPTLLGVTLLGLASLALAHLLHRDQKDTHEESSPNNG